MRDSIIIIGAGMGGLAAGIYGRMNGYRTTIFESHSVAGGQCASWKRDGYTFDVCIHHLFGCDPGSGIHRLWRELGVMPRELVPTADCASVLSTDGRLFQDLYDLEALERHLLELAPADAGPIREYVKAVRLFVGKDIFGELMMGSRWKALRKLLLMPAAFKYLKPTMAGFAERFSDPFLRAAFPLLVYSAPEAPLFIHLIRHAHGTDGGIRWPVGGALKLALSMEARYRSLGGEIRTRSRVERILVEDDKAVGVRLADGTEHRSDIVISDADGRKTILELLEGRYADARVRGMCREPADETNWAVHVFLGVRRDLSREPSALVMLLDGPVTIAGHANTSLEMQIYGFDPTMSPAGSGVIKVELVSAYSYWKRLGADRAAYEAEKKRVASQVIELLERRFPGISGQVETVDVPTVLTWERYMGGTHGFANMPSKRVGPWGMINGLAGETTLPGLSNFRFVGVWASMMGALFGNALTGRHALRDICREDGRPFRTGSGD